MASFGESKYPGISGACCTTRRICTKNHLTAHFRHWTQDVWVTAPQEQSREAPRAGRRACLSLRLPMEPSSCAPSLPLFVGETSPKPVAPPHRPPP